MIRENHLADFSGLLNASSCYVQLFLLTYVSIINLKKSENVSFLCSGCCRGFCYGLGLG